MELKKIEKDGAVYFQLYVECPSCSEAGNRSVPAVFWTHADDDGDIYIGDNAHILCEKCGKEFHVSEVIFGCSVCNGKENHKVYFASDAESNGSTDSEADNKEDEATGEGKDSKESHEIKLSLADVMAIGAMMVSECGLPWLQNFMASLESGWR